MASAQQPRQPPALGPAATAPPDDAPPGPWTLARSYQWCERIAADAYANLPAASHLLAGPVRANIAAIYAFAKTVDDVCDEARFEGRRAASLADWEALLERSHHGDVDHPVFVALRDTVRRHVIPIHPFKAMLTAARLDLSKRSYASFAELLQYCMHAANPLGRLVLLVHGYREPEVHRFSDEICSALQLAKLLSTIRDDLARGRCYVPQEDIFHFGLDVDSFASAPGSSRFEELMRFQVARARAMFWRGEPLLRRVADPLAQNLAATWEAGMRMLSRLEKRDDVAPGKEPSAATLSAVTSALLFI